LAYLPVALAVKWPLGLFALIAARVWTRRGERAGFDLEEIAGFAVIAVVIASCMTANLDYGIRYAFPVLPFLCVWCAGLLRAGAPKPAGGRLALAGLLLAAIAIESARALPYPLSFFNAAAGGPGRGDRIVNDSNVDWGQGLVALRRDLDRYGIHKVHLAYHGTVDPALYGIDYVTYTGGNPGPESDWLAVSSYFLVGLPARMTTDRGMSEKMLGIQFGPLLSQEPVARPANCMYLFRLR
jgi:hypothetical protein